MAFWASCMFEKRAFNHLECTIVEYKDLHQLFKPSPNKGDSLNDRFTLFQVNSNSILGFKCVNYHVSSASCTYDSSYILFHAESTYENLGLEHPCDVITAHSVVLCYGVHLCYHGCNIWHEIRSKKYASCSILQLIY